MSGKINIFRVDYEGNTIKIEKNSKEAPMIFIKDNPLIKGKSLQEILKGNPKNEHQR